MKLLFCLSLFLFFSTTTAKAEGLNYYGRVFYNGAPVQTESAEITFQITGNDPNCVLYEEIHGNVLVNNGLINEIVGAVGANISLTYRPVGLINIEGVFKNTFSYTCQNGGTYNPLTNPERNLVVYFRETPLHNAIKLDPKPIKAVPLAVMAQDAEKLAGKDPSSYLQVSAITDQSKLDQLVLRQPELLSLIPASGPSSAIQLPTSNSSGGSAGMIRYNSTNFTVEYYNGSGWAGLTTGTGGVSGGSLGVGKVWVGNNFNQAVGVNISGDASLSDSGALTVLKMQGRAITVTAPTLGQMLKWNGVAQWELFSFPDCGGNNTLHYISLTDSWSCDAVADSSKLPLAGGTLFGPLNLPNNGLSVGSIQLVVQSGNVGIGNAAPGAPLDIHGANRTLSSNGGIIQVFSTNSAAQDLGGSIAFGGADGAVNYRGFASILGLKENATIPDQSGYLAFGTRPSAGNMTEKMRITSNGNVGIGTTTPSSNLHIKSTNAAFLLERNSEDSTYAKIEFMKSRPSLTSLANDTVSRVISNAYNSTGAIAAYSFVDTIVNDATSGNETSSYEINTRSVGLYHATTIRAGNLGVNVSSPGNVELWVSPNGDFTNQTGQIRIEGRGTGRANLEMGSAGTYNEIRSYALDFSTVNNLVLNSAGGNVGIGTTTPDVSLQVVKTSAGTMTIPLSLKNNSATINSEVALDLNPTGNGSGVRGAQISALNTDGANSTALLFKTQNGSAPVERLRIDPAGNVGVGTTSPGATLDVAGHVANSGASATIGPCGTSPAITGNDTRGLITLGTGSPTSCTITFQTAYSSTPYCVVAAHGGDPGSIRWWLTETTTTLVITFSATPTASQQFEYHCMQ